MLIYSALLATAAAGCNAVSSVVQRKANRSREAQRRSGLRLIAYLVQRPLWLLGVCTMIVSFLLQAFALGIGTLSAVEPILAIELPLTLVFAAWTFHRPLRLRDWLSATVMAAGLAAFVIGLAPSGGHPDHVSTAVVIRAALGTAACIAGLCLIARVGPDRARAAILGVAAGSCFGLTASLLKMAVARFTSSGVSGLLTAWQTYALAGCGLTAVMLVQSALHVGTLVAVQPGLTLLDPFVSVLWGTLVLRETIRHGPVQLIAVVGVLAVVVAVFALAHASKAAAIHRPRRQSGGTVIRSAMHSRQ
jgi:drug/metabolite transporter (DMT)-like permease